MLLKPSSKKKSRFSKESKPVAEEVVNGGVDRKSVANQWVRSNPTSSHAQMHSPRLPRMLQSGVGRLRIRSMTRFVGSPKAACFLISERTRNSSNAMEFLNVSLTGNGILLIGALGKDVNFETKILCPSPSNAPIGGPAASGLGATKSVID